MGSDRIKRKDTQEQRDYWAHIEKCAEIVNSHELCFGNLCAVTGEQHCEVAATRKPRAELERELATVREGAMAAVEIALGFRRERDTLQDKMRSLRRAIGQVEEMLREKHEQTRDEKAQIIMLEVWMKFCDAALSETPQETETPCTTFEFARDGKTCLNCKRTPEQHLASLVPAETAAPAADRPIGWQPKEHNRAGQPPLSDYEEGWYLAPQAGDSAAGGSLPDCPWCARLEGELAAVKARLREAQVAIGNWEDGARVTSEAMKRLAAELAMAHELELTLDARVVSVIRGTE